MRRLPAALLLLFSSCAVWAQTGGRALSSVDLQRLANGVLGVMSYTVAPDVTTSSISVENAATGNPGLTMTQFGGGFTWSKGTPLYLEGNAAYSRYDPTFVASDGTEQRAVPVKWNAFSATGGVGWDFTIAEHWVLRPIFNFTLGYVASDLVIARWWLENRTDTDLDFLEHGRLNAYGLGGSLMLDYEKFAPEADHDLELRYTNVQLRSYGNTDAAVEGRATAASASVWARRRVPLAGWAVWDRPVRYVLEGAYTQFLGSQTEIGFDRMASLGVGIEFDSSAKDIWATRWRALLRYKFGPDISGYSLGLAVSF
ncbi:MAG: autotransporter domain-containing protein [Burkholderiales bacterium]|nr:MAG: autotransporter domain-containing protein [Burkholderiales bacterium]